MLDPYKMVYVNLTASFILCVGLLIYKYVYPKRDINLFVVLILVSILPLLSLLRPGTYESGDFNIHIYRSVEFYRSLTEGQLLPSWAGGLNATYGYPLFILNYTLPYYVISIFHFFGFDFISSLKLFLAVNFIFSGIFMYLATKQLLRNDLAAFTAAIFYQFAPYHLIDLHFKVVIGEIMVFTTLPLVMYLLLQVWRTKSLLLFCIASLSIALLIMSHVVIAFFGMLIFFSFAVYRYIQTRKKYFLISTISIYIAGSLCSIYQWLTPFFMSQYTRLTTANNFAYFPEIWELLFSPWRFGLLFQGHKGELSFLLGYAHIFVTFILVILLLRKTIIKKHHANIIFWVVIFALLIFLISPYSKPLWGTFQFLKITGSHRLLILTSFVTAILAGYLSLHILKRKTVLVIIIGIAVFSTILNWGHRRVIPEIKEQDLINYVWKSTSDVEGHFYANSKWRPQDDPWFDTLPKNPVDVIKGIGEIKALNRNSVHHSYIISADTDLLLRENTLYFPGWKLYIDNNETRIDHDNQGIITFNIPKGLYYVELIYQDIALYGILKIISAGTLSILIISYFMLFYMRMKIKYRRASSLRKIYKK